MDSTKVYKRAVEITVKRLQRARDELQEQQQPERDWDKLNAQYDAAVQSQDLALVDAFIAEHGQELFTQIVARRRARALRRDEG